MAATSLVRELSSEGGLTPLHLAAYSGSENVVRGLLNSPAVQVRHKDVRNHKLSIQYYSPYEHVAGKTNIKIFFLNFSTEMIDINIHLLHTESF